MTSWYMTSFFGHLIGCVFDKVLNRFLRKDSRVRVLLQVDIKLENQVFTTNFFPWFIYLALSNLKYISKRSNNSLMLLTDS